MESKQFINHTPAAEWHKLKEILGQRERGTALFTPFEIGYECPVCGASNDIDLTWSEFNGMLWCHNCEQDWPSCICKRYFEPRISERKLTKQQRAMENKRVFVATIRDFKKLFEMDFNPEFFHEGPPKVKGKRLEDFY